MNNVFEIMVVDDESQIRKLLSIALESNEYRVKEATNSREALQMAASHPPDMILLDLGLPDENGQETLKKLREWYTKPIMILSVQNREEDIVTALDNGANDYLVKPFRTAELLARMRALIRNSVADTNDPVIAIGTIVMDLSLRVVKKDGEPVKLTATEYNMLALLAKNAGKVLTHQFILRSVWGPGYIDQSQYLRVFVAQLRKKIEDDPNHPAHLLTESGVGYRLV